MSNIHLIPTEKLISETAKDLKEKVKLKKPEWAMFVKTGSDKERIPENEDWWWIRAASILRKIYLRDGKEIGIERLKTSYGGRKHRGVKPGRFQKGSGKIIRVILQEFDSLGFTEKTKKGRKITKKGREYLNKISSNLLLKVQ